MEMLGLMHEAEPYGHLVLGGRAMDYGTLSQLIAVEPGHVKRAVKELEAKGVFSRTDDGTIYSRRMVRDKNKEEMRRQNGAKGGNPNLINQRDRSSLDNMKDKATDNARLSPQKPEARNQKPESKSQAQHPGPRDAVPKSRTDYDQIEAACREAADVPDSRSPGFANLAPIIGLLEAGYDLERDILPSLRRQAARAKQIGAGSWNYFVKGIADDRRKRQSAQAVAKASTSGAMPSVQTDPPSADAIERTWRWKLDWRARTGSFPTPLDNEANIPRDVLARWKADHAAQLGAKEAANG
ncbi:hypothetical protein [Rhodoplanes serenus]|uniref:hypothetical protein n=1 Tax=Rhodoplanes serenus TaxID=200615 RepID=UPI0011B942E0|nr:hypothetical protein [Rhodoplanes serenus]